MPKLIEGQRSGRLHPGRLSYSGSLKKSSSAGIANPGEGAKDLCRPTRSERA